MRQASSQSRKVELLPNTNLVMNKTFNRDFKNLCNQRMAEITEEDRTALLQFAECRLVELGIQSSYGEDLTQTAFEAVVVGMQTEDGGRRPRIQDVADKATFINYMRGVISSLLYALTQKREFRASRDLSIEYSMMPLVGNECPAHDAEILDLRSELFSRMRARAPRRLLRTIDAWEPVFMHSDRIPGQATANISGRLKRLPKRY